MAGPKNEREAILLCIKNIVAASKAIRKKHLERTIKIQNGLISKNTPALGLLWAYAKYRASYRAAALRTPSFVVGREDQDTALPDIDVMQIIRLSIEHYDKQGDARYEAILQDLLAPSRDVLFEYPLVTERRRAPTKAFAAFTAARLALYLKGNWKTAEGAWAYATEALIYYQNEPSVANTAYIYNACLLWVPRSTNGEWPLYMWQFFNALTGSNLDDDEDDGDDDDDDDDGTYDAWMSRAERRTNGAFQQWLQYARRMAFLMIAYAANVDVNPNSPLAHSHRALALAQQYLYEFVSSTYTGDKERLLELGPLIVDVLFGAPALAQDGGGQSRVAAFRLHSGNFDAIHDAMGGQHHDLAEFVHSTGGGTLNDYLQHLHATRDARCIAGDIASSLQAKYARRGTKKQSDITFPEFEQLWLSFLANLQRFEEARGDGNHALTQDQITKRKSNKVSGAAPANNDDDDDPMPTDRYASAPTMADRLAAQKEKLQPVDPAFVPYKPQDPLIFMAQQGSKFQSLNAMNNPSYDEDDDSSDGGEWEDNDAEEIGEKKSITITKDTTGDQQTNTVSLTTTKPAPPPRPVSAAPPLPPRYVLDTEQEEEETYGNSSADEDEEEEEDYAEKYTTYEEVEDVSPPSKQTKNMIATLVDGITGSRSSLREETALAPVPSPAPKLQSQSQREEVTGRSWDRAWKTGTDILDFLTTQDEFDVFTYYIKWAASMRYSIDALRSLGSKAQRPYSRKTGKLQDFSNYYKQNKKKGETEAQFIERNTPLFTTDMSVAETMALMNRLSRSMMDIFKQGLRSTNKDWNAAWKRVFPSATVRQRREMYDFYFFVGEIAQSLVPSYKRTHGFGYASPYVFVVPKDTKRGYEDHEKRATFAWKLAHGVATGASTSHFAKPQKQNKRKEEDQKKKKKQQKKRSSRTKKQKEKLPGGGGGGGGEELVYTRSFFGEDANDIYMKLKRENAMRLCGAPMPSTVLHENMLAECLPNVVGNTRYQPLLIRDDQVRQLERLFAEDPVGRQRFLQQQLIDRHRCLHNHDGSGTAILCNAEGHRLEAHHVQRFQHANNDCHAIPGQHPVVMEMPLLF